MSEEILINITLQGRHDSYPKRRGLTRVPELMACGLTVAFGQDDMLDPWYSLGCADMLEVASMGLHVAQMTSQAAMRQCFDAVTRNPARILQLEGYGLEVVERVPLVIPPTATSLGYLTTKREKLGHLILPDSPRRKGRPAAGPAPSSRRARR